MWSGGACFAHEAQPPLLVGESLGWQHLRRHDTLKPLVLSPVDDSHGPSADVLQDAEVRERPANHLRNQGRMLKP